MRAGPAPAPAGIGRCSTRASPAIDSARRCVRSVAVSEATGRPSAPAAAILAIVKRRTAARLGSAFSQSPPVAIASASVGTGRRRSTSSPISTRPASARRGNGPRARGTSRKRRASGSSPPASASAPSTGSRPRVRHQGSLPIERPPAEVGQPDRALGARLLPLRQRRAQHLAEGSLVVVGGPAAEGDHRFVKGRLAPHHLFDVARREVGLAPRRRVPDDEPRHGARRRTAPPPARPPPPRPDVDRGR